MPRPTKPPNYVGIFELMDERRVRALLKKANARPTLTFIERINQRLAAGTPLRELSPGAWEPMGNLYSGGYGFDARALPNGHFEVRLSVGRRGEAHLLMVEVGFGPRGGIRYFADRGFRVN